MKRIIFLVSLIAFAFVSNAQELNSNFLIDNGKIIWQKLFDTDLNFDQIAGCVKESGVIRDMEVDDNKISGQIQLMEPDYKGAGHGEMSTPMFISRSFVECFALAEYREGRYRVTLRNIVLTQKYNDGVSKEGEKSSLESYALDARKNEIKKGFMKKPAEILNYTFTKSFTFASFVQDDEW